MRNGGLGRVDKNGLIMNYMNSSALFISCILQVMMRRYKYVSMCHLTEALKYQRGANLEKDTALPWASLGPRGGPPGPGPRPWPRGSLKRARAQALKRAQGRL